MNRKFKHILFYGTIISTIMIMVCLAMKYNVEDLSFNKEKVSYLPASWLHEKGGQEVPIKLPAVLDIKPGEDLVIKNVLPRELIKRPSLLLRTSHQSIVVYVGQKRIYERGTDERLFQSKAIGSNWNLIELNSEDAGKEITIILNSPYKNYTGGVREITYGSRLANLFLIIEGQGTEFIFDLVIFGIGLCLFIISLYLKTRKNENNVLLYFSEFSIVFAIWMIGEARMLQFFIGNVAIISLLPFVAILIFPLPFVLFVEEACELHHPLEKKFLTGIYWAFTLNLIVSLSIHLLNIYALPESLWMTHILCGVGMTGVVVCCLYEAIKFKNEDARKLLRAEGIFFLFAAIEMIKYYLGTSINLAVTQYLRIGYIIFAIMIGADSIAKIQRMSDERKEREYYQKLAYIDLLTHGRNRTAYMEEMDTLFQKGSPEGIGLILFDLNNLKKINDELGHLTGDEAIQKAYQCIEDVFGKIGKCYRVGGDEFACVIMNAERDILENLEISFRTVIKNAGDGLKYDFQVAMGFAIYSQEIYGDKAYEGLYSQADQNMYQDKANLKKMRQVL